MTGGFDKQQMNTWQKSFGYRNAINGAAINFILREFVMSKVSCDEMSNMDMTEELHTSVIIKSHHISSFRHQTSFFQKKSLPLH